MNLREWRIVVATAAAVALSAALVVMLHTQAAASDPVGDAFVLAFDPQSEAFAFSYTLPTTQADPQDVLILEDDGHTEAWIAESGADRIGRLTYTDSSTYQYQAYDLAAGSEPLSLLAHAGYIWFTASGADAVGRLDPGTGQIDIFDVGAGTYPADLVAGPEGDIWFTQMMADQVAQLMVTSTTDYAVQMYADSFLSGGRPRGIAIAGSSIYLAQTANDRISIFTPPNSWIHMPSSGFPITLDEPYALAADKEGHVWGTERSGNVVGRYGFGSFPDITRYALSPPRSEPTGIAFDPNDDVWFTQRAASQIGRLRPDALGEEQQAYYALPQDGLEPTGIATDEDGGIWVVASRPYRLYLPLLILESS